MAPQSCSWGTSGLTALQRCWSLSPTSPWGHWSTQPSACTGHPSPCVESPCCCVAFPQAGSPPEATSSYHMATWWGSLLATSLDTFQGTWVLQGTYGEGSPTTEHPHFCWPQYSARGGDGTLHPCILPSPPHCQLPKRRDGVYLALLPGRRTQLSLIAWRLPWRWRARRNAVPRST